MRLSKRLLKGLKNNPGIDMEKITEIFYLIERHLVERKRSR